MITMKAVTRLDKMLPRVKQPAQKATFKNLQHASAAIRLTAQRSLRKRKKASAPGQPPSTQTGQIKRAILYHVYPHRELENQRAVIGPAAHLISHVAASHEHGGSEPADRTKRGTANYQIKLGGHGPLRKVGRGEQGTRGSKYVIIRIETEAQLQAVTEFASTLPIAERGYYGPRKYPRRPFMGPALNKNVAKLPRIWAGSVRG